ncbi:MAG: hypothetical protein GTN81_09365 [Proteobacteria bacterium]|nr:hypothetical protein [Pseudomonadota bacterium]
MEPETRNLGNTGVDKGGPSFVPSGSDKYRDASQLIRFFVKTTRSYRIYAPKNPVLKKFVDQLFRTMGRYLKKHGSFRFDIEDFKFVVDGEVIYENENMTESLPFLMHRNGLRGLWFDAGLSYNELVDLLETFRSYEILKDSYEDLVTLLWDKEFSAIEFWATDDFLWAPVEIPQNMKEVVKKMEMPLGGQERVESETPLPRSLFKPGELDEVKETIPAQIEQVDYVNLLMILAEIVSNAGKDGRDPGPVFDFFKIVLDKLLLVQDFKNLIKILSFTKILIRDRRLDSHEEKFIERIRAYLGEPQSIERLIGSLARFENFDHEQLQKYLLQLSKNAIAPLCSAWLKMESAEGRMAISSALIELGKEDIPTLGGFLKHNEWPLVFNVVNILGKIGKDECVPYLAQVREHESAKVRNESLYGLSLCKSQKVKALLPTFLDDREMRIRITASRILAEKLDREALPCFGAIIRSRDFNKRDIKERKAFLENLGRIREPDSALMLREVLYRRVFRRRQQWKEIKVCVESVLASMDLQEADALLVGWKKDQEKWFFRLLY